MRVSFFCCTFVPIFNTSKDMAAEEQERGYAVGVQTFDWIRERKAVYADKTQCVWKMVTSKIIHNV